MEMKSALQRRRGRGVDMEHILGDEAPVKPAADKSAMMGGKLKEDETALAPDLKGGEMMLEVESPEAEVAEEGGDKEAMLAQIDPEQLKLIMELLGKNSLLSRGQNKGM